MGVLNFLPRSLDISGLRRFISATKQQAGKIVDLTPVLEFAVNSHLLKMPQHFTQLIGSL